MANPPDPQPTDSTEEEASDLRHLMELKHHGGGYDAARFLGTQVRQLRLYRLADLNSDYLARSDSKIEAYDECLAILDAWCDRPAPVKAAGSSRRPDGDES